MLKAFDSLDGLLGYNEEANLSLMGPSRGSRSTDTIPASPIISEVLKHSCSWCEDSNSQTLDENLWLPSNGRSCLTVRLGLACITWINFNILQNDTVKQINITRDGWVRVMGTEQHPTSRHLMFELFQDGMS